MANEEHIEILKRGVGIWNQWRNDNPDVQPDLSSANLYMANLSDAILLKADLTGADLGGTDLTVANLTEANLIEANLAKADLRIATLRIANLNRANLRGTDLRDSDLSGANLIEANLLGAILSGANLSRADFNRSNFGWTAINNVDLSEVIGIVTVIHDGPSSIGIDTIYKSQGKIPEIFLRNAGVPDDFLEFLPSLVTGKAIQFYSCFISYATKDQEFAERLHADLQSKGVRCWFAPEDIKGGRKLHEQIPEAIRLYDKLLLVLSENSMQSEWVKTEIYQARQDEISNGKRKLFPIGLVEFGKIRDWTAFDADSGKDMAREIREYFIPDFSNWKDHDAYKKAFDRLLNDLQTE